MLLRRNIDIVKKIVVLKGGWSSERAVSLLSGKNVADTFRNLNYEVFEIDVKKDLRFIVDALYKADPDYIFNALHGSGGEDGVIQGMLEIFGKPYSGSGVLSSSVCFNKCITKTMVQSVGIITPKYIEMQRTDIQRMDPANPPFQYPFVIKPSENGSSVGVTIVKSADTLASFQKTEWTYGEDILLEKYITGREFTVLVVNQKAIGSTEITYKSEFYSYDSKYNANESQHVHDYTMPSDDVYAMHEAAEKACLVCRCKGTSRVDFIYDGLCAYFLEINTQPGMTNVSLVPDIAKYKNILLKDILINA
jgi:D-alanine-D-alanine ligase